MDQQMEQEPLQVFMVLLELHLMEQIYMSRKILITWFVRLSFQQESWQRLLVQLLVVQQMEQEPLQVLITL